MKRRKGNWDYLLNSLNPDIALLQETSSFAHEVDKTQISQAAVKRNVRNTIFVKSKPHERLKMPSKKSYDGEYPSGMGIICSKVNEVDIGSLFAICVYGNLSFSPGLHYPLLGLITLFVTMLRNDHGAEHIILSGDLNMDRRMDDNPTGTRFARKGEKVTNAFFDGILNLGFSDCLRKFYPDYVQTYRHNRGNYPWELDHVFATDLPYKRLHAIEVMDDPVVRTLSDHNPIVADFQIA